MPDLNTSRVIAFKPDRDSFVLGFRTVALEDRKIFLGRDLRRHIFDNGVSRLDVVRLVQGGEIIFDTVCSEIPGSWTCLIRGKIKGYRELAIATVVFDGANIFINKLI